jgi:hypothetical protein
MIGPTVDQRLDAVALRPGTDARCPIAAFAAVEEPALQLTTHFGLHTTAIRSRTHTCPAVQALSPLASLNPAQAERVPGRIRVDLEVVDGVDLLHGLQHLRTQRHDTLVGGHEVLDPQVEVDLLRRCLGSVGTTAQAYLRVPVGVAIGVFFLAETVTLTAWIGLACVVTGVAAMTIPSSPARRYRRATAD